MSDTDARRTLAITIAPGGDGKAVLWVTVHGADGTPLGPPRAIAADSNWRLAGFVDAMQAFAQQQLAPVKASTEERPIKVESHGR